MAKTRFSRRDILRYGGAAGVLCLPLLQQRSAQAAENPRFLAVFFPNGTPGNPKDVFFPRIQAAGRDWSGLTTEALAAFDKQLISFEKLLLNRGVGVDPQQGEAPVIGQHTDGMAALLTGSELTPIRDNHTAATGLSIDEQLVKMTGARRLYTAVSPSDTREYRMSWAEEDRPNNPETSPRAAYESIVPLLMAACGEQDASIMQAQNERKLVLDALVPELQSTKRIFGLDAEERQKLELYETHLAELGRNLQAVDQATQVDCDSLDMPALNLDDDDGLPNATRLHMEILALAIALRAVDVGLLQLMYGYSNANYNFIDGVDKTNHHGMQHGSQEEQAETVHIMRWHIEQFAFLLSRLDSYKEGAGSALDNSIVLYGSDVPNGFNHRMDEPHCTLVAGGGAGRIRPGTHITGQHNHVDLLATLCTALQIDGSPFKRPEVQFGSELDSMLA